MIGVDQLAIDMGNVCHKAVRPTPAGTSLGVVSTHPPTTHPRFHRLSKKFRVFLGSSPGVWEVEGRFPKFQGVFGSSPGVLGSS